jgi:hypothetical protein
MFQKGKQMEEEANICIKFLKVPTNAIVFINVILLHSNHQHVSATHVTFFRMMRTVIFATALQKFVKVIYAGRACKCAGLRSLYIAQEHKRNVILVYRSINCGCIKKKVPEGSNKKGTDCHS